MSTGRAEPFQWRETRDLMDPAWSLPSRNSGVAVGLGTTVVTVNVAPAQLGREPQTVCDLLATPAA